MEIILDSLSGTFVVYTDSLGNFTQEIDHPSSKICAVDDKRRHRQRQDHQSLQPSFAAVPGRPIKWVTHVTHLI